MVTVTYDLLSSVEHKSRKQATCLQNSVLCFQLFSCVALGKLPHYVL